ncbi:MAG: MogA/MoaB family molybdenum cofactor biosynthesis protein [Phycisphaerales bacterium]|nr:MogA/MoaB family molybdenum cofactor biosynthesis protein [Phycisphaerales bacterium]
MPGPIRAAILTISDRCSRGETVDTSGPALARICTSDLGAEVVHRACVTDDPDGIEAQLGAWVRTEPTIDLILTTGGTGLAPRDHAPEAAMRVIERPHAGLMELARLRCYEKTPRAYLSRGVAGAARQSLIITLPGSERGSTENLQAILDILPHAIETLRGEVVDDGRTNASDNVAESPVALRAPADRPPGDQHHA